MTPRPPLVTDRLVLRALTTDDIAALVDGLDDYAVSSWLTVVPHPYGADDAVAFLDHLETAAPCDGYGITRDGGPVMGVVGIDASLGYWLARAYHGQGYMTEAAGALVGHYFATGGAEALTSGYFDGNMASARVLVKLGFRHSHDETVMSRARGASAMLHRMRLTRADWAAGRGQ